MCRISRCFVLLSRCFTPWKSRQSPRYFQPKTKTGKLSFLSFGILSNHHVIANLEEILLCRSDKNLEMLSTWIYTQMMFTASVQSEVSIPVALIFNLYPAQFQLWMRFESKCIVTCQDWTKPLKNMSWMPGPQATIFVDRAGRLRGMQFERLQVIKQLGHPSCWLDLWFLGCLGCLGCHWVRMPQMPWKMENDGSQHCAVMLEGS